MGQPTKLAQGTELSHRGFERRKPVAEVGTKAYHASHGRVLAR